jgi:hypothetical protein
MFGKSPAAVAVVSEADDVQDGGLIALSVLALDLVDAPLVGWDAYLAQRHIAIVVDDIGRRAVSRSDARELLAEQEEYAVRKREVLARQEQQAVEADRQFRAQLHPGIPAGAFGDVDPIAAQIQLERDADPRHRSMQEELWDRQFGRSGDEGIVTTYHPLPRDGDGS